MKTNDFFTNTSTHPSVPIYSLTVLRYFCIDCLKKVLWLENLCFQGLSVVPIDILSGSLYTFTVAWYKTFYIKHSPY